jgi:hypothetical protein
MNQSYLTVKVMGALLRPCLEDGNLINRFFVKAVLETPASTSLMEMHLNLSKEEMETFVE